MTINIHIYKLINSSVAYLALHYKHDLTIFTKAFKISGHVLQLGAEFIGTFIMIFAAAGAPIVNQKYNGAEMLIGNATSPALAVMVVIFSTGHISGAHLNPAVTIAFAALRHFPWSQVVPYIVVQVLASISASFALKVIFHPFMSGGVTVPAVSHGHAFALEFIVTFILMFIITAVATDTRAVRTKKDSNLITCVGVLSKQKINAFHGSRLYFSNLLKLCNQQLVLTHQLMN